MYSLNQLLTLGVTIALPALVNAIAVPGSPGTADAQLDKRDPQACLPTCARATHPPKLMAALDLEKRNYPTGTVTWARVSHTPTPPPKLMNTYQKRESDDEGDLGDTTGDPHSVFEKRAGASQAAATGGLLT
ncbi:hypothetical protein PYCC9005_002542 [Savitreella phatthalungensis]